MSIAEDAQEINRIDEIGITDELLTPRAGLAPLAEFLRQSGIAETLASLNPIKKNSKGVSDVQSYLQILLSFIDGTSVSLTHFDALKSDPAYLSCCGISAQEGISSHSVKRFLGAMGPNAARNLRRLLLGMFQKALRSQRPDQVILDIDTVVYDNDTALMREGCSPTYKKVKGFQPLMVKWGSLVVWSEFREGKVHSNHGTTVNHSVMVLVQLIRSVLGPDVPILVTLDSGFFDQKIFNCFASLGVGYVCSGKMYKDILEHIATLPTESFRIFESPNPDGVWEYVEINDQRGSWNTSRRAVYTRRTRTRGGQLEMLGLEAIYYTNLDWDAQAIISTAHSRGEAELLHRKLKQFAGEILPFRDFYKNEAWFFLMLIAFDIFELFKTACDADLGTAKLYPTTFRRKFIDQAGKVVHHAHKIVLKTTKAFYEDLTTLWRIQAEYDYSAVG